MKKLFLITLSLIHIVSVFAQKNEVNKNWQNLFNGNDLTGWKVKCLSQDKDKDFWKVVDGVIECNSIGQPNHNYVWLMHENEYDDFELQLKFQIFQSTTGNSGIQFRSRFDESETARGGGWLNGPQADIHPPSPFRAGMIYDETDGVNRWIYPSMPDWKISENDVPKSTLKTQLFYADENPDAWNTMKIHCDGMKVKISVNDNSVTDFDATGILDDVIHKEKKVGTSGQIALQLHASDEIRIRFKDIKIRKL